MLEADLPIHSPIACKLVVRGENNTATWEPGEQRSPSAAVKHDQQEVLGLGCQRSLFQYGAR